MTDHQEVKEERVFAEDLNPNNGTERLASEDGKQDVLHTKVELPLSPISESSPGAKSPECHLPPSSMSKHTQQFLSENNDTRINPVGEETLRAVTEPENNCDEPSLPYFYPNFNIITSSIETKKVFMGYYVRNKENLKLIAVPKEDLKPRRIEPGEIKFTFVIVITNFQNSRPNSSAFVEKQKIVKPAKDQDQNIQSSSKRRRSSGFIPIRSRPNSPVHEIRSGETLIRLRELKRSMPTQDEPHPSQVHDACIGKHTPPLPSSSHLRESDSSLLGKRPHSSPVDTNVDDGSSNSINQPSTREDSSKRRRKKKRFPSGFLHGSTLDELVQDDSSDEIILSQEQPFQDIIGLDHPENGAIDLIISDDENSATTSAKNLDTSGDVYFDFEETGGDHFLKHGDMNTEIVTEEYHDDENEITETDLGESSCQSEELVRRVKNHRRCQVSLLRINNRITSNSSIPLPCLRATTSGIPGAGLDWTVESQRSSDLRTYSTHHDLRTDSTHHDLCTDSTHHEPSVITLQNGFGELNVFQPPPPGGQQQAGRQKKQQQARRQQEQARRQQEQARRQQAQQQAQRQQARQQAQRQQEQQQAQRQQQEEEQQQAQPIQQLRHLKLAKLPSRSSHERYDRNMTERDRRTELTQRFGAVMKLVPAEFYGERVPSKYNMLNIFISYSQMLTKEEARLRSEKERLKEQNRKLQIALQQRQDILCAQNDA